MRTLVLIIMGLFLCVTSAQGADFVIENGKTVKFDYKLTVDGQVVDTSEGKQPLEYVQGQGMIIPGLEKEMAGMKVGDQKTVEVPANEAYGAVNPEAFQEVPRESFPADADIQQGMVLPLKDNNGQPMPAVVSEVKDSAIVLNFNHPLAGKDLTFDIKVVDIQ